ncbi:MAG TPA: TerC family protein [Fimbriimonadaceae bacterium]|nr:TerC family protein [Fimbriimonadaceae bacterium]
MLELVSSSAFASFWGQTFEVGDLGVVAFLVLLEALLSADNALVLAIMVRHLPRDLQRKALLYGLGGAFVFRLVAILLAASIISLWWLQAIGALYLLILPIKHFLESASGKEIASKGGGFWQTVVAVELADIAFAIDSVLAGVALIDSSEKIWVVYLGAIIGVVLLRFAAGFFVKLLERFPSLDAVAYVLVGWVGVKLAFMAGHNGTKALKTDFSVPEMSAYVFWSVLATICVFGTLYAVRKKSEMGADEPSSEPEGAPRP